jgi:hypothetical protein
MTKRGSGDAPRQDQEKSNADQIEADQHNSNGIPPPASLRQVGQVDLSNRKGIG